MTGLSARPEQFQKKRVAVRLVDLDAPFRLEFHSATPRRPAIPALACNGQRRYLSQKAQQNGTFRSLQ